jgi:hypothetical protein
MQQDRLLGGEYEAFAALNRVNGGQVQVLQVSTPGLGDGTGLQHKHPTTGYEMSWPRWSRIMLTYPC